MTSCNTFCTLTRIVMLIKQFVRKNALNSEVFLWKLFQKKTHSMQTTLCWAAVVSMNQHHPQLNDQKVLNLKLFMRECTWRVPQLCGLYKMDFEKIINELQFPYIMRWHRCSITPRVINKVHIGTHFEYIISKRSSVSKNSFSQRITRSNSSKVNKLNKQQRVIQVTRTHARERRGCAHRENIKLKM